MNTTANLQGQTLRIGAKHPITGDPIIRRIHVLSIVENPDAIGKPAKFYKYTEEGQSGYKYALKSVFDKLFIPGVSLQVKPMHHKGGAIHNKNTVR